MLAPALAWQDAWILIRCYSKRGRQEKISSLQKRRVTRRRSDFILFEEFLAKICKIEVKQDVPDCLSGDILILQLYGVISIRGISRPGRSALLPFRVTRN